MISKSMLAAAPLFALLLPFSESSSAPPVPLAAVTAEDLMRHIRILASDEFEGRKPGTAVQNKTLFYIASQFASYGLEPAGTQGWYQPIDFAVRTPSQQQVTWSRAGVDTGLTADDFRLFSNDTSASITDAPVYFIGHGIADAAAGVDELANVDLAGAVVLMWPDIPKDFQFAPRLDERMAELKKRGVAAVVAMLGSNTAWPLTPEARYYTHIALADDTMPSIFGYTSQASARRLLGEVADTQIVSKNFKPIRLDLRASLAVTTAIHIFTSYNVIGRLRGSARTGESVLYLGHWDHLGICRPEGAPDRICNGAADNASGIAGIIEVARHIASGPRTKRDLLFMATTAEEMGLLGAKYFAAHPVVPSRSIVVAINSDTIAIAPKGKPIAILGRGTTELDPIVDETARMMGRGVDIDEEANVFAQRQDGWYLTRLGIPTVMANGSFSDMQLLQTYLGVNYHKPEDDVAHLTELGGAVEDTDFMIALGRRLADPKIYRRNAK